MPKIIIAVLLWLAAIPALACTSVTGQATITQSGFYCLTQNIFVSSSTEHGITVNASGVIIDLQGRAIVGPGSGIGSGVHAVGYSNVTVRGGNVSGFLYGVRIEGAGGRVERMDASDNLFRGIRVFGSGAIVERNRIKGIWGTGGAFANSHSFAIEISGPNCHVRFNMIDEIYPYSNYEGVGVSVSNEPSGCQVYDNLIRWEQPTGGRLLGIWAGGGANLLSVHNNVVLGSDYGLFRGDATANSFGNLVEQRCPVIWDDPDYTTNNDVTILGGCTDPEAGF